MKLRAWLLGLLLLSVCAYAVAEFTVGPGGMYIATGVPSSTAYKLYNDSGTLYWNGAEIGSGGGGLCGITYVSTTKYAHIADSSGNIQTAINTGKPVFIPAGTYTLTAPLSISTSGQIITGAGIGRTILYVPNEAWAKLATNGGIINLLGSEPGPVIRDLSIRFVQPDVATRGALNQFIPAIYFGAYSITYGLGSARAKIQNVEILGALTGIDLGGTDTNHNSGGTFIDNVRICAFKYGIFANQMYDNARFTHIDIGPYGTYGSPTSLTANQTTVFRAVDTYGVYVKRQDGLHVSNSNFKDVGMGIYIGDTGTAVQCMMSNTRFVNINYQALYAVNASSIFEVSDCLFSFDNTTSSGTSIYAGTSANMLFSSCEFRLVNKPTPGRLIDASGSGLTLTGCRFYIDSSVTTTGFVQVGSTSSTVVSNNIIEFSSSTTNTPFIYGYSGSGFTLMNNRFTPAGGGRDAYGTAAADYHIIIGNYFNGWTASGAANVKADNIS